MHFDPLINEWQSHVEADLLVGDLYDRLGFVWLKEAAAGVPA